MGYPGALTNSSSAQSLGTDPAAAFLLDLEVRLPELRRDLLAVADPDVDPSTQPQTPAQLAAKLRMLAQLAASHRHSAIAKELGLCEAVMRAGAVVGRVAPTDRRELDDATSRLAHVLEDVRRRETTPPAGAVAERGEAAGRPGHGSDLPLPRFGDVPATVLVVGSPALASWLRAGGSSAVRSDAGDVGLDVESSEDAPSAHALVHALAPDVVVIDLDVNGARDLVRSLTTDPSTQPTPIVAIGPWHTPEEASDVLELGVARALCKPVSPAALRRACHELATNPVVPSFVPMGHVTVDELADRLSDELRHGLSDAIDEEGRRKGVDLGPGVDVMAALWGAVARIRELVSAKSNGTIHFVPTGPEGAVPTAAWLTSQPNVAGTTERSSRRHGPKGALEGKALTGRTVIVAEDDLSVNWFLAGVLKQAGAHVLEARDGAQALSLALESPPDLIVTDILMPRLDGFALSRAVRRDVVLRDVPVVLLSWKEDLLQRARELEVGAEGYLRKEESGATVVRHLAELLLARNRVAGRIASTGPVHGRLDGLSAYSLLQLVCLHRPDSRVTVRDAISLYEIEIRRGRPVAASRVTAAGEGEKGAAVLQALLGVSVGRFGVVDADERVPEQLGGTLNEQLAGPIALARAAQSLLIGPALLDVDRITFDQARIDSLLEITPNPAGGLLRALANGESPNELLRSGRASASLLDSVLGDVIRHGAVRSVVDRSGTERLALAIAREQEVLRGRAPADTLRASLEAAIRAAYHFEPPASDASDGKSPQRATTGRSGSRRTDVAPPESSDPEERIGRSVVAAPMARPATNDARDEGSPDPEPPVVVARAARPGGGARVTPILASGLRVEPVLASSEPVTSPTAAAPEPGARGRSHTDALAAPSSHASSSLGVEATKHAQDEATRAEVATQPADTTAARGSGDAAPPGAAESTPGRTDAERDEERLQSVAMPSNYAPSPRRTRRSKERSEKKRSRLLFHVMVGVAGVSLAIGARWLRERPPVEPPPDAAVSAPAEITAPGPVVAVDPTSVPGAPATEPTPNGGDHGSGSPNASADEQDDDLPMEFDLGKGEDVGAGEGILEIVAGKSDQIYVNGKLLGKGPVIKVTLKATDEPYEVRVKLRGEERVRYAMVKESKRVRLRVAPPWKR